PWPGLPAPHGPPGLISPPFSASRMICRAGRSLTDWPGFMNSALPRIVQPVAADARLSLISGVLPIAATMSSLARMGLPTCSGLVRRVDQSERSRSLANDEDPGFLVLGAVPMHLPAEMRDETAARHGHHIVFVDFVAGCDPPRAVDHGDEAIVGMEMRLAEVAGLESIEDDVEPALGRIALQDDLVGAGGAGRIAPLVLIGQSVDDGSGI